MLQAFLVVLTYDVARAAALVTRASHHRARAAGAVSGARADHMSAPIRVLELRSVWGTGGGPDKTILAGAGLLDPARVATTICYIRDARDQVFALDQRAAELGLDYVEVIERNSFDPAHLARAARRWCGAVTSTSSTRTTTRRIC